MTFNAKQFRRYLDKGIEKAHRRREKNKQKRNQKRRDVYLFYTRPAFGTHYPDYMARYLVEDFYGAYE